ncbi:Ig-like domain-containing protein, partial [Polynucleobacter sp.]|uniref:Ig-like domain-containing protein n=1 Tax=Polynucleobacter sp. TaxID=2029855 RepID=UPI0037CB7CD1
MKLALIVVQDGQTAAEYILSPGSKTKAIKVKPGQNFILVDQATGKAPQNIRVVRKGNKLSLLNSADPANSILMELDDFYALDGTSPSIAGIAEDGQYYQYVSADASQGEMIAQLADGGATQIALNSQAIGLAGANSWLLPALLIGGGMIAGAAILTNGFSGKTSSDSSIAPEQPNPGPKPSGPQLTDPSGGTSTGTSDTTPSINIGLIPKGSTPQLVIDGVVVEAVMTTDANGNTILTPVNPLPDGSHEISVQLVNPDGSVAQLGDPIVIVVDTIPPETPASAPQLIGPTGGTPIGTNDTTPGINVGPLPNGSTAQLIVDGEVVETTTTTDANGNTILTPVKPLPDGSHDISYQVTDPAGTSPASPPFTIVVDTLPPETPTTAPTLATKTGSGNDASSDNTPAINVGQLPLGSTAQLLVDGAIVAATISVDAEGNTILTPTSPLGDGPHNISYQVVDPAGTSSASPAAVIVVDTLAPDAPTTAPLVNDPVAGVDASNNPTPGINVGPLPNGSTAQLVVDGVVVEAVASTDANGNTILTPTNPLPDGPHDISYQVVDPAGNASPASPPVTITVDTTAPDAPTTAPALTDPVGGTPIGTNNTTPGINV